MLNCVYREEDLNLSDKFNKILGILKQNVKHRDQAVTLGNDQDELNFLILRQQLVAIKKNNGT